MNTSLDIAEFYQQLSLLVKAKLPLPESLEQLGRSYRKRGFRDILDQISSETASGKTLHESMARHEVFPEFHIELIRTGEESGALPEVLNEVAQFAKNNQNMVARTRETMAYPAFTIFVSLLILLLILRFVVPGFESFHADLNDFSSYYSWYDTMERSTPLYSRVIFLLSHLTISLGWGLYVIIGAIGLGLAYLFSGGRHPNATFYQLMKRLPGTSRVIYEADWARVAAILSVYLKRKVPMVHALKQTAGLVQDAPMKGRLFGWAERLTQGASLSDLLADEKCGAEPLFALCIRHSPEKRLGEELNELANLYIDRAEAARKRAIAIWQFIMVATMTFVAGWVIFSMMQPMLQVLRRLG